MCVNGQKYIISNIGYVYIRSHVGIVCCKAGGQYEVFVIQFEASLKLNMLKLIIVDIKRKNNKN